MSKGIRHRDLQVSEDTFAERWEETFGPPDSEQRMAELRERLNGPGVLPTTGLLPAETRERFSGFFEGWECARYVDGGPRNETIEWSEQQDPDKWE